jgi:hypothetical protein
VILPKQRRRNDVDAFISALSGKDRRDQKLECVGVIQGAMRRRVGFFETPDYLERAFALVSDHSVQAKKEAAKMQIIVGLVRI